MVSREHNNLLIDAGNSSLKWALYRRHGHVDSGNPVVYPSSKDSSRNSLLVSQLAVSWQSLVDIEQHPLQILVSNVAGSWVMDAITRWVSDHLEKELLVKDANWLTIDNVVAQESAHGVVNAYKQPERLGADRWASLVAARQLISDDCCIIDCGSALTIDVLSRSGEHKGGIISPGWQMMKKSLMTGTDAITSETISGELTEVPLLGRDTREAIEAGIVASCTGAVSHVLQHFQEESGSRLHCVITGGGARKLLPHLSQGNPEVVFQYEPDWVLKGLAIISDDMVAEKNVDVRGYLK